jgi:hypothetical protein
MIARLFVAMIATVLVLPTIASSGRADGLEQRPHAIAHKGHFLARTFGSRSEYAPVTVKALFDSCWRYREKLTPRGRETESFWTCGNYIKPNADFDWGYGRSIADQARYYYEYPW